MRSAASLDVVVAEALCLNPEGTTTANRLFKHCARLHAEIKAEGTCTWQVAQKRFHSFEIDELGLKM